MKEEIILKEKIRLLEKEIGTLAEDLAGCNAAIKDLADLSLDIKGLKLFLGRVHPEFKKEFPEIVEKIKNRGKTKS